MKVLNNLSFLAALALIGVSSLWATDNGKGNQFYGGGNAVVRTPANVKPVVSNSMPVPRQQITLPTSSGKTYSHPGANSNANHNRGNFDKLPTKIPDRVVDVRLPTDPIKLPAVLPPKVPGNKPFPPIQIPGNKPQPLPPVVIDDVFPKPIDPKPPVNHPHPHPPQHPHHPGQPGWNPGYCHPHHCPPVVLDCFRSCYCTAVVVAPVGVPDLIVEMPVSTGKSVIAADAAIPQALNGDTITLMFATPQSLEAGRAVLLMGEKTVELTIVSWQADSATVKLPKLLLTESIPATIYIGNAKGEVFLGQELRIIVQ